MRSRTSTTHVDVRIALLVDAVNSSSLGARTFESCSGHYSKSVAEV
jgi:hypothetical protein